MAKAFRIKLTALIGLLLTISLLSLVSAQDCSIAECTKLESKTQFPQYLDVYVLNPPEDTIITYRLYEDKFFSNPLLLEGTACGGDSLTIDYIYEQGKKYILETDYYDCPSPIHKTKCYRWEFTDITEGEGEWVFSKIIAKDEFSPICEWCPSENNNSYFDFLGELHCATSPDPTWGEDLTGTTTQCFVDNGHVFFSCREECNSQTLPFGLNYKKIYDITRGEEKGFECCVVSTFCGGGIGGDGNGDGDDEKACTGCFDWLLHNNDDDPEKRCIEATVWKSDSFLGKLFNVEIKQDIWCPTYLIGISSIILIGITIIAVLIWIGFSVSKKGGRKR